MLHARLMQRTTALAWIHARGGVAHTSDAYAAGFTKHHLRALVVGGQLERVRRSWLVTPECDAARRAAASVGGRLTCVSAARALGIWTPPTVGGLAASTPHHVSVPRNASRLPSTGFVLHRAVAPSPAGRHELVDPTINVLFHSARCLPRSDALAVWESALRKHLVDAKVLARVQWRSSAAREIARVASDLSDSGLETRFRLLMRSLGVLVRQQVWLDGHPVDALIGERLVVQLDGFAHHSSPADRRRDLRADARLKMRGYTVLRFDYAQVLFDHVFVIDCVASAMAQRLHLAS